MINVKNMNRFVTAQGDCKKLLKQIPDNSVDLILCDPPYNIAQYSTGNIKFDWRSDINNDVAAWDQVEMNPFDFIEDFKRVLTPCGNIFVFTSYNLIGKWHQAFDPEFDTFQFMIWHKTNPVPNFRKSSFLNSCEMIVCMWNKGHIWNFTTQAEMHNFIESPICMGAERIKNPKHPTQKPVAVLKHIIEIASNPNSVVLDMFMGVGSTGVAALELGRKFIGIEIDNNYYSVAVQRLKKALQNSTDMKVIQN